MLEVLSNQPAKTLNVVNCCTALNRLSRLGADRETLHEHEAYQQLLQRAASVIPGCDAKQASILAHACASLGVSDHNVLAALGEAVRANSGGFDRQGLAMVLWALAKLPRASRGDAPVEALTRAALACREDFTRTSSPTSPGRCRNSRLRTRS